MPHGLFFSFDGIDGAGKSTQLRLFVDWMRAGGRTVTVCRDPGTTRLGEALRDILLGATYPIDMRSEMLLYMAARSQLVAETIRPALAAGHTVVSDRFALATVVYQGCAGSLPVDDIWQVARIATAGTRPQLTFVLDVPWDVASQRLPPQRDRMERRGPEYFAAVRQGFLDQARQQADDMVVIDAAQDIGQVQAQIRHHARRLLED